MIYLINECVYVGQGVRMFKGVRLGLTLGTVTGCNNEDTHYIPYRYKEPGRDV